MTSYIYFQRVKFQQEPDWRKDNERDTKQYSKYVGFQLTFAVHCLNLVAQSKIVIRLQE